MLSVDRNAMALILTGVLLAPLFLLGGADGATCDGDDLFTSDTSVLSGTDDQILIAASFPVHSAGSDPYGCGDEVSVSWGIQNYVAFQQAIDDINSNDTLLPDTTLGYVVIDSCSNSMIAANFYGGLMTQTVEFNNVDTDDIWAIFLDLSSDVGVTTANIMRPSNLVQITSGATSSILDDKTYYNKVLRTGPSSSDVAEALVAVLGRVGVTYVSLVYTDDGSGADGFEAFADLAIDQGICIATNVSLSLTTTDLDSDAEAAVETLVAYRDRGASAVVMWTAAAHTMAILEAADDSDEVEEGDFIWFGTDAWADDDTVVDKYNEVAAGAVTLKLRSSVIAGFESQFMSLDYNSQASDTVFTEWWDSMFAADYFDCSSNSASACQTDDLEDLLFSSGFEQDQYVAYTYNAVYALAKGLENLRQELCPDTTSGLCDEMTTDNDDLSDVKAMVYDYVKDVKLTGSDGYEFQFNTNGDGDVTFEVLNYQSSDSNDYSYKTIGKVTNGVFQKNYAFEFYDSAGDSSSSFTSKCSSSCSSDCSTQATAYACTDRASLLSAPSLLLLLLVSFISATIAIPILS